jgi:hypothetical protein
MNMESGDMDLKSKILTSHKKKKEVNKKIYI